MIQSTTHLAPGRDVRRPASPRLVPFDRSHLASVVELFAAEGWDSYTVDPERTARALSAPGCTTLLAVDRAEVVALVQMQSDGEIQAHLSALLVAGASRRRGLARRLLHDAFTRAGGHHIDVLTRNSAFYESLGARSRAGFRLTPLQLTGDITPHTTPHSAPAPPAVTATNRHRSHS